MFENSIKNILTNESIDNIKKEISSKKQNLKIIRKLKFNISNDIGKGAY